MKKFLIAVCAVSMISGVTAASAQTGTKHDQQTTDLSAAKKKMKKSKMMKQNDMSGGGMQGGGMQGGGMQGGQGNMQKKGM